MLQLGSVLSYTPLEPEETEMLLGVIHDFLDFLVEKKLDYFKGASQYQVKNFPSLKSCRVDFR